MAGTDLPPIDELAERLAEHLGAAGVTSLSGGAHPSAALRFGSRHPVLVRTFAGGGATASLPRGPSADLRSSATLADDLRSIRGALGRRPAEEAPGLADAVVALRAPGLDLGPCTVDFPGVAVPDEAWVRGEGSTIGLFHTGGGLFAVVWVGRELHRLDLPDGAALAGLAAWVARLLERQRAAAEAASAERARLDALPVPTLAAVWAHLRAGHDLTVGGGRWRARYWLRGGVLWITERDEGDVYEYEVDDPDRRLQAAIDGAPHAVRGQLDGPGDGT